MSQYDFDLFVIGAGSGGVRAARISAGHGARVAVCEDMFLGGTCVNVGCVPKKLLVYGAHFSHEAQDAAGFGWAIDTPRHDWRTLIANKDQEIARLNGIYRRLIETAGATLVEGRGVLVDAHTVEVAGKRYTADRILIAVGGWPTKPEIPGIEHAITSTEAFYLDALPKTAIMVGGGYIAVEFAGIFAGLGAQVTQLCRGDRILRGFDDDIRDHLSSELVKHGIDLRPHTNITAIEKTGAGLIATLTDGTTLAADQILYATGRKPKTVDLGLEAAGVAIDQDGAVIVDEHYRTTIPNIYAIGDVTNRVQLTPVALAEGHYLADTLFARGRAKPSYRNIATAVFSIPPVGTVGLTEQEALDQGFHVDVYVSTFRPMKATLSGRDEKSLMKLIVDRVSDRVLGAHMVGPDAGEIMQGLAIAMNAGATKAVFDQTIGIHPTAAEEFVTMRTPRPDPKAQAAAE